MKQLVGAALTTALVTAAPATAEAPTDTGPPPPPYVVKKVVHRPPAHRRVVRRFTPPAHPAPGYVLGVIAPREAARFGARQDVLTCRIRRESGGRYWAANGQYHGVGQFAYSTFTRGLRTMPHRVELRARLSRLRRSEVVRVYSDGRVSRTAGRYVRQRVLVIRRGRLPRWPVYTHAWAQVRIMAQALVGRSAVASSEWSTREFCG